MVVPFTIHHEIVEYLFEESERLPEDFYVNIMDLMKKYHDKQEPHVYDEIRVYLDNNKNRINGDIFKKIKKHFCFLIPLTSISTASGLMPSKSIFLIN